MSSLSLNIPEANIRRDITGKTYLQKDPLNKIKTEKIFQLTNAFEKSGFEIRIVGGAVRDILLGKTPKDIDFATIATPDEIMNICDLNQIHFIKTGLTHGTITAVIDKTNFEITTLRSDDITDGRHAAVSFIKEWKLDAERRDLTVNAMSLSTTGELFDYFNGVSDLQNRRIRFVNDPTKRIREDYLRILRFFRFYGKIALAPATIDNFGEDVLNTIIQEAPNLCKISSERIWTELSQIFIGNFAPSIVDIMWKCKVLEYSNIRGIRKENIICFNDFWSNSINRMASSSVPSIDPASLLATLLPGSDDSLPTPGCLKLSNREKAICEFISHYHFHENSNYTLRRYQNILARLYSKKEVSALRAKVAQLMLCEGMSNEDIDYMLNWEIPIFPVNGHQLKPYLSGAQIGYSLSELKNKWIESNFIASEDQLLDIFKHTR